MMKWKNLFDWTITNVSRYPKQEFLYLDEDKERRVLLGYSVEVAYKTHKKKRFFKVKKPARNVRHDPITEDHKSRAKRFEDARQRALKYISVMDDKKNSQRPGRRRSEKTK